jgi:hypothetical protein
LYKSRFNGTDLPAFAPPENPPDAPPQPDRPPLGTPGASNTEKYSFLCRKYTALRCIVTAIREPTMVDTLTSRLALPYKVNMLTKKFKQTGRPKVTATPPVTHRPAVPMEEE